MLLRQTNSLLFLSCLLALAGCAQSASNLKPDNLASLAQNEGGYFGRISVTNKGETVTGGCYARFTDREDSKKAYVSLDDSGWVFSTAEAGPTYLSFVICTLGGVVKYNASFESRDLAFEIKGGPTLSYFGHVQIELNFDDSGVVAATILGGAVGNAIATSAAGKEGRAQVQNELPLAIKTYESRFGKLQASVKTVASIVGAPLSRMPASK